MKKKRLLMGLLATVCAATIGFSMVACDNGDGSSSSGSTSGTPSGGTSDAATLEWEKSGSVKIPMSSEDKKLAFDLSIEIKADHTVALTAECTGKVTASGGNQSGGSGGDSNNLVTPFSVRKAYAEDAGDQQGPPAGDFNPGEGFTPGGDFNPGGDQSSEDGNQGDDQDNQGGDQGGIPGGDQGGIPGGDQGNQGGQQGGQQGGDQEEEDTTDYSQYSYTATGTWSEEAGYGYVFVIDGTTVHGNYDVYTGNHYFFYAPAHDVDGDGTVDKAISAVKFTAKDTAYMRTLAADYEIYEARTCQYHFYGGADSSGGNLNVTDIYLMEDGTAVDITGRDSVTYTPGTWTKDGNSFTITLGEGGESNTYKTEYSSTANGWRLNRGSYYVYTATNGTYLTEADFPAAE